MTKHTHSANGLQNTASKPPRIWPSKKHGKTSGGGRDNNLPRRPDGLPQDKDGYVKKGGW